jgi:hypothetical protein
MRLEQKENIRNGAGDMRKTLSELQAREEELTREWQWLHDALHVIAGARADGADAAAFRLLWRQAMHVGERRNEVRMAMAELERDAWSTARAS